LAGAGDVRGVCVGAMVPSLAAVDASGTPITPGLLYGDRRGRTDAGSLNPAASGEILAMLRWTAGEAPDAAGYWPAQAVAGQALAGVPLVDLGVAAAAYPLFSGLGWDEDEATARGVTTAQMPTVGSTGESGGTVHGLGAALAPGSVDALGEQLVAGAEEAGDVLVICGTTLITWAVMTEWREVPGLWSIPHHVPGRFMIGGPSNAGGLFLGWTRSVLAASAGAVVDPGRVPVWQPYLRGERTPLHDNDRRGSLHGLDLTHDAAALRRAAYEAAGFVVRHHLDLADAGAQRIVATGGGVHDGEWVQALADCTRLPVDVVAVPEGGALGMAWLARMAAGLETSMGDARRWARTSRRVEPDPRWAAAVADRYELFRALSG
jgi:xylulokinase